MLQNPDFTSGFFYLESIMKIKSNHPLAKHGLVVGEQVNHNGINYTVQNESFGQYELEPDRLCSWKGRTAY